MSKPLYDEIIKYIARKPTRFHMPSHFGTGSVDTTLYSSARFDITELPFSDNLQNPVSVIGKSEEECANGYGTAESFYFTSGATTAIFTALAAARAVGEEIIVQRASHKSVYSAIRFFGYKPHYIYPSFDSEGFPLPVTAKEVERAIIETPSAQVVMITSPDYFGRCADASAISDVCKKYGKLLIADEAHGAHLPYSELLPKGFSSLADMEITSLHKTLSVYTGGAVLNLNNRGYIDKIRTLRADIHTTSPSYVVLASMDYALDEIRLHGENEYKKLHTEIETFKNSIPLECLQNDDFTRLVIRTGRDISALDKAGIVPETTYGNYTVFIVNQYNVAGLASLAAALKQIRFVPADNVSSFLPSPVAGSLEGQEAFVSLADAVGKTAAREAGIYPPGIPVVARGETITPEIAQILSSAPTFGFVNDKLCVIL